MIRLGKENISWSIGHALMMKTTCTVFISWVGVTYCESQANYLYEAFFPYNNNYLVPRQNIVGKISCDQNIATKISRNQYIIKK
jgi:hypothetical protein